VIVSPPLREGPPELETRVSLPEARRNGLLWSSVAALVVALGVVGFLVARSPAPTPAPTASAEVVDEGPAEQEPPPAAAVEPVAPAKVAEAPKAPEPKAKEVPVEDQAAPRAAPEDDDAVVREPPKAKPQTRHATKPAAPMVVEAVEEPSVEGPAPLSQRDLDAVTIANMDQLTRCRGAASGIEVVFKIHPSGMVFGLRVNGAADDATRCLKRVVRRFKYPAHAGPARAHRIKL